MVQLCAQWLSIEGNPDNLGRSLRLGKFSAKKNRQVTVQFSRFKEEQNVMLSAGKLEEMQYAVREDLSLSVGLARTNLLQYAHAKLSI